MRITVLACTAALLVCLALPAAVLSHRAEVLPFQFRDIRNSGTRLSLGDDQAISIPSPFTFLVYDNSFPRGSPLWISSNGLVAFVNAGASSFIPSAPNTASPNAVFAPLWADLLPSASTGFVSHQTFGSAPNRMLIVQWTVSDAVQQW